MLWRYIQESDGLLSQLLQQHIISSAYFYTQLCMLAPLDVYSVTQRTLSVACTAGVTSVRSPSVLTRACPSPPSVPALSALPAHGTLPRPAPAIVRVGLHHACLRSTAARSRARNRVCAASHSQVNGTALEAHTQRIASNGALQVRIRTAHTARAHRCDRAVADTV